MPTLAPETTKPSCGPPSAEYGRLDVLKLLLKIYTNRCSDQVKAIVNRCISVASKNDKAEVAHAHDPNDPDTNSRGSKKLATFTKKDQKRAVSLAVIGGCKSRGTNVIRML